MVSSRIRDVLLLDVEFAESIRIRVVLVEVQLAVAAAGILWSHGPDFDTFPFDERRNHLGHIALRGEWKIMLKRTTKIYGRLRPNIDKTSSIWLNTFRIFRLPRRGHFSGRSRLRKSVVFEGGIPHTDFSRNILLGRA